MWNKKTCLLVEQEGIKLMARVQEIHCPHCGEHVGRWTFFHRLAANEELDESKASELLEEKKDIFEYQYLIF